MQLETATKSKYEEANYFGWESNYEVQAAGATVTPYYRFQYFEGRTSLEQYMKYFFRKSQF